MGRQRTMCYAGIRPPAEPVTTPDSATTSSPSRQAFIARALDLVQAIVAFTAGGGLAAFSVLLAVRTYTPLPVWDQWQFYYDLVRHGGYLPLAAVWSQHNEHRPVLLRLLCLADARWFSGTNVFLYICLFGTQVLSAALLVRLGWRYAGWRGRRLTVWLGLVLAFLFNPAQRENFTWAWQVCFMLLLLTATAGVTALLHHAEQQRRTGGQRWTLALTATVVLSALAWLSLAGGFLVAALLAALAWRLRLPRAHVLSLAAAVGLGALVYFWGYRTPPDVQSPLTALTGHLGRVLLFWLVNLGGVASVGLHESVVFPVLIGMAGVGLWAYLFYRWVAEQSVRLFPAAMLFLSTMALAILGTASTARVVLEGNQPVVSRYQSIAVFFWLGLAGCLLERWSGGGKGTVVAWAAVALTLIPLLTLPEIRKQAEALETQRFRAEMATATDVGDREFLSVVLPHPDDWPAWREFVESRRLSQFADPFYHRREPVMTSLPGHLGRCVGAVDTNSVRIVGGLSPQGVFFTGWAWDQDRGRAVSDLVVLDEQNRVVGYAKTSVVRADVRSAVSEVTDGRVGWEGYAPLSRLGRKIRVFGVDGHHSIVCQSGPEIVLTAVPPARLPQ